MLLIYNLSFVQTYTTVIEIDFVTFFIRAGTD